MKISEKKPKTNLQDIDNLSYKKFILVKNACENNLKGINIALPQGKFIVITGVSGSGKSSLAFDTLYAEGQRRYVESLSSYIRQFLGKVEKPKVDYIKGLSPAIAIKQKVNTTNPRSTVGTTTEIYDYLKLFYARIGKTYSPISGALVTKDSVESTAKQLMELPEGTKLQILSKLIKLPNRTWKEELKILSQKGFSRLMLEEKIVNIHDFEAFLETGKSVENNDDVSLATLFKKGESLLDNGYLLIDRVAIRPNDEELESRISDSLQTAFFESHGACTVEVLENDKAPYYLSFSNVFEKDGISFEEPSVNLFSFNNPYGACPTCEGLGTVFGIDEEKVIADKTLSLFDGVVSPWKGDTFADWKTDFIKKSFDLNFPIHRSYSDLTPEQKKLLWEGDGKKIKGIYNFFEYIEQKSFQIQYRILLSRYRGKTQCRTCGGSRLRKDALYVKIEDKSIADLINLPCDVLFQHFQNLKLTPEEQKITSRLLKEIINRLGYLNDVGLGYLTLNRPSKTLSGGESQRIQLVTSLGSNLTGSLYILDEPSIGLHSKDTERLIKVLKTLQSLGNTLIVVEHDEDIIRHAEEIIDIGQGAGSLGGEVVFQGTMEELLTKQSESLTGKYLRKEMEIPIPKPIPNPKYWIQVENAQKNNLKSITVKFPLNAISVVTGLSGSGKSTLIRDVLHPILMSHFEGRGAVMGATQLSGDIKKISAVEYIDQNPIGKSARSNPVTYLKAYDGIRDLFASTPMAKLKGYTPGFFSFNVDGGRCDQCKGEGIQTIEMQFMADVEMICEECHGKRFKDDIQEVTYKEKSISDVLNMTVKEAVEFFEGHNDILKGLKPLQQVGLEYLTLGQPSSHLSGGEAQRIKLASFLMKSGKQEPILFIFDEPTTGLHFHDINLLMNSFYALIQNGHTVIIIEHNMDVIKCADWIIDLGKEGGENGGYLLYQGFTKGLIDCKESYTAQFLKEKFS